MLATRVIPCLDVKDGRVVKGVNFVSLRDAGDPVQSALRYDEAGADEIVFLDIAASNEGRRTLLDIVERTADVITMPLTVGGGVSLLAHVGDLLLAGADKVSINSAAVRTPELITQAANKYGSQAIVVAIDAKRDATSSERWTVYTHGGQRATELDAVAWASEVCARGAGEVLLTSIDRDGTKNGYDCDLLSRVASRVRVPLVASGGVGSLEHFAAGVLAGGASAVLAASVFHDGVFSIAQVKSALAAAGVRVRSAESS